jgi:hypothetical protein
MGRAQRVAGSRAQSIAPANDPDMGWIGTDLLSLTVQRASGTARP